VLARSSSTGTGQPMGTAGRPKAMPKAIGPKPTTMHAQMVGLSSSVCVSHGVLPCPVVSHK